MLGFYIKQNEPINVSECFALVNGDFFFKFILTEKKNVVAKYFLFCLDVFSQFFFHAFSIRIKFFIVIFYYLRKEYENVFIYHV